MNVVESVAPSGSVDFVVRRAREGYHKAPLSWKIRNYRNYFWMAWERIGLFFAHIFKLSVITSELRIKVIKPWGEIIDYGKVSCRKFTQVGGGFIVDAFNNSTEMENMKYHALGTSTAAEDNTHTALQTEITNTHYSGSARPAGSTEEGASAWIYKTIGTHTQTTAGDTIAEHGILSQAATGGGVLLDRHTFTGIALAVNDQLVATYQLTFTPEA